MMMGLENIKISQVTDPGTAQTEAYPQGDSARPLSRSSWSSIFLKREHQEECGNLSCSPRTSSYTGALATILAADDSRDACFFSQNSQVTDAKCENDRRVFKRRGAREEDQSERDQNEVIPAAKPRRRAFVSKLGRCPQEALPSHTQLSAAKNLLEDPCVEEEFRISSILRSGKDGSSPEKTEINHGSPNQLFNSPPQDRDRWDLDGGFDGDDESDESLAMQGLTLQLSEADFRTPGLAPSSARDCWRQSHHHLHHRSTSRWLPRRFHEAGLDDEETDSLVPPEQLTTLEEFNHAFARAAIRGDRGRADSLWREMCSQGILPNLALLNSYTKALTKSLAHPDETEIVAREVCLAGDLSPNATTFTLLTEARLRYEQIFSEI